MEEMAVDKINLRTLTEVLCVSVALHYSHLSYFQEEKKY